MAGENPADAVTEDLKGKVAEARAGEFHLNGHTLFLMVVIGLGAFAAYVLIIKPKQTSTTGTTSTDGTNATSGQQPAAFISEPVSVVVEPSPTVATGGTTTTSTPAPPVTATPIPGNPTASGPARSVYTVQSGDTISSIAAKEHLNVGSLEAIPGNYTAVLNAEKAHGITTFTYDKIFPGTKLYLD